MNYRNPAYNAVGTIDCEVEHPVYGWIAFTASPDDTEQTGREIHAAITAAGGIAAYVPPSEAETLAAWRQTASTTRRAFCIACRQAGILTAPDAIAAAKGEWPASMSAILGTMTDEDAADAQVTWAAVQQVDRTDPLILAMQAFLGLTDAQVDGLFA